MNFKKGRIWIKFFSISSILLIVYYFLFLKNGGYSCAGVFCSSPESNMLSIFLRIIVPISAGILIIEHIVGGLALIQEMRAQEIIPDESSKKIIDKIKLLLIVTIILQLAVYARRFFLLFGSFIYVLSDLLYFSYVFAYGYWIIIGIYLFAIIFFILILRKTSTGGRKRIMIWIVVAFCGLFLQLTLFNFKFPIYLNRMKINLNKSSLETKEKNSYEEKINYCTKENSLPAIDKAFGGASKKSVNKVESYYPEDKNNSEYERRIRIYFNLGNEHDKEVYIDDLKYNGLFNFLSNEKIRELDIYTFELEGSDILIGITDRVEAVSFYKFDVAKKTQTNIDFYYPLLTNIDKKFFYDKNNKTAYFIDEKNKLFSENGTGLVEKMDLGTDDESGRNLYPLYHSASPSFDYFINENILTDIETNKKYIISDSFPMIKSGYHYPLNYGKNKPPFNECWVDDTSVIMPFVNSSKDLFFFLLNVEKKEAYLLE